MLWGHLLFYSQLLDSYPPTDDGSHVVRACRLTIQASVSGHVISADQGASDDRNSFSHSSGDQKFEIKASSRVIPSGLSRGVSAQGFSPASGGHWRSLVFWACGRVTHISAPVVTCLCSGLVFL